MEEEGKWAILKLLIIFLAIAIFGYLWVAGIIF